jgi:hypothetical protein
VETGPAILCACPNLLVELLSKKGQAPRHTMNQSSMTGIAMIRSGVVMRTPFFSVDEADLP